MYKRFKRNRISQDMRELVRDVHLCKNDLIYPVFVVEGSEIYNEISSMPNQYHYSVDKLDILVNKLQDTSINKIILFGIPAHKDEIGSESFNKDGVIQKAIKYLKSKMPKLFIVTDVCMCEYTDHGHCGVLENNRIDNDATVEMLAKIALSHVKAGADMVAPSDMSDGDVFTIRNCLDENGFKYTPIMSYSAKYASSYYGPFREAANSAPEFGDRKYYQMDYRNSFLGVEETVNDINEGADIVIIKPALAYLDIVSKVKQTTNVPVAVYNVSGEYSMIKAASKAKMIDEKAIVLETMYAFKRAGASIIITYFALDVAKYLMETKNAC
ncbi:MAG: porphobilinogen synthase [Bacilli bacterium]